jgi:hypothetical protein
VVTPLATVTQNLDHLSHYDQLYITNRYIPQLFYYKVSINLPYRYIHNENIVESNIADAPQQRGLEIAATANMVRKSGAWIVPYQSGKGRYTACSDDEIPRCTCPDHETRGVTWQ